MKIDRNGRITTGTFAPRTSYEHWWRRYPYYRDYYEDTPENYNDLFSVAKAFGVTADEVQALLDYGCSEEEIEEMLYESDFAPRNDRRAAICVLIGGDFMDAAKIVLGVMTVIGLLADLLSDDD